MLFNRSCILEVGEQDLTGLAVVFDIKSGYQNAVKRATFRVYNMSENSINNLESDQPVSFQVVGKDTGKSRIFYGFLSSTDNKKEIDGSIVTTLYCWSGNSAYMRDEEAVSFDVNTQARNILDWISNKIAPIEISINDATQKIIDEKVFTKGLTLSGTMDKIIRRFAKEIGTESTLDDIQVYLGFISQTRHYISSTSDYGMKGIPSVTITGVQFSSELNPDVRIGDEVDLTAKYYALASSDSDTVSLNNRSANGIYQITNINQKGDTHNPRPNAIWETNYDCFLLEDIE